MSHLRERVRAGVQVIHGHGGEFGLDFSPLFNSPILFDDVITWLMANRFDCNAVAGIEAMGFPFATVVAHLLDMPFIPIRKAGESDGSMVLGEEPLTEKSTVKFEVSTSIRGRKVLVIDDTIHTGTNMAAALRALLNAGATPVGAAVMFDVSPSKWRERPVLIGFPVALLSTIY